MDLGSLLVLLKLADDMEFTVSPKTKLPSVTTTGTAWEVLTGAGVRGVDYTIDLDPTSLAAWRAEQAAIQAMRRL